MFQPVLAADFGSYVGLAILVFSVLGWIINAIKGNDPNGKPLPKRNKPKRDLRSELEVFLEELQKPQEPVKRPPPPQPAPAPPRQTTAKTRANRGQKSTANAPRPSNKPNRNKGSGQSVREHVATFMGDNRVATEVQQHLSHRIDQAVQQDLSGGTVAAVEPAEVRRSTPHPLLSMLARPEGMRQAILINEVLQRPRSLSRPKS
ncbi:hypothetical protein GC163_00130 [bacterium]|nr:hypothetical protein [bacterium]